MSALFKMFLSILLSFLYMINFALTGFSVPGASLANHSDASTSDSSTNLAGSQSIENESRLNSRLVGHTSIGALLKRTGIPQKNVLVSDIDNAPTPPPSDWYYDWHTFYEPIGFIEHSRSITVDGGGGTYIIVTSQATWKGPEGQPPLNTYSGARDITMLKLDASGAYQWHTFFGSSGTDLGGGIAVDGSGGIYILGSSMYSWDGPLGQLPLNPHTAVGENFDLTVIKLDASGAYQWHTFYGGVSSGGYAGYDFGIGIALSENGELYIAGTSQTSWDGSAGQVPLHAISGKNDIAVLKLSAAGAYQWHTFYGSPSDDSSSGIAVDDLGGVYIHGSDYDSWNGPNEQPPLHEHVGSYNIYALKLNASGEYQWHTFYGGGSDSSGIAIDNDGGVYINGSSLYSWTGPEGQLPLHPFSGDYFSGEITVLKINTSGAYQWHTFYGSPASDDGSGIAVDGIGGVYLNGASYGSWNGPTGELPLHAYSGASDIVVLKLDALGAYQWHTFYGSPTSDGSSGLAMDAIGRIYNLGISDSSWLGPAGQVPLHEFTGAHDITVLKLTNLHHRTYLPLTIR